MAETIKGGRYQLPNKQWVNGNGDPVDAPVDEAVVKAAEEAVKKAAEKAAAVKASEKKGK